MFFAPPADVCGSVRLLRAVRCTVDACILHTVFCRCPLLTAAARCGPGREVRLWRGRGAACAHHGDHAAGREYCMVLYCMRKCVRYVGCGCWGLSGRRMWVPGGCLLCSVCVACTWGCTTAGDVSGANTVVLGGPVAGIGYDAWEVGWREDSNPGMIPCRSKTPSAYHSIGFATKQTGGRAPTTAPQHPTNRPSTNQPPSNQPPPNQLTYHPF